MTVLDDLQGGSPAIREAKKTKNIKKTKKHLFFVLPSPQSWCLPGVAAAVTGPMWGNFVDSGASRKWLLQVGPALPGRRRIHYGYSWLIIIRRVLSCYKGIIIIPHKKRRSLAGEL